MTLASYLSGMIEEEQMFLFGISNLLVENKIEPVTNHALIIQLDSFFKVQSGNGLITCRVEQDKNVQDGHVFTYRNQNGIIILDYYYISDLTLKHLTNKHIGNQE